jgi:hypothetical protein
VAEQHHRDTDIHTVWLSGISAEMQSLAQAMKALTQAQERLTQSHDQLTQSHDRLTQSQDRLVQSHDLLAHRGTGGGEQTDRRPAAGVDHAGTRERTEEGVRTLSKLPVTRPGS